MPFVKLSLATFVFMQVDDTVTFKLLKRSRDSIIPVEMHPSPDPSMPPGQERDHSDTATSQSQTSWGHKEGTSTLPSTGDKAVMGHKAKEGKHHSKHKQGSKDSEEYGGRGFNKYAKFTRVGDGKAFWKAAAQELASYAAQVGGRAVLCCAVLCCAVLHCAVLCCALQRCVVPWCALPCLHMLCCCAALCCATPCWAVLAVSITNALVSRCVAS